MQNHFISPKIIKFLAGGVVAATINFILIILLINHWGFNTPQLRNLANFIAIEAGLIIGFFIYRYWVWQVTKYPRQRRFHLLTQFLSYHLAGGSALLIRTLIVFPLLNALNVNFLINTFIGMIVGTFVNYLISDNFVFKT